MAGAVSWEKSGYLLFLYHIQWQVYVEEDYTEQWKTSCDKQESDLERVETEYLGSGHETAAEGNQSDLWKTAISYQGKWRAETETYWEYEGGKKFWIR